MIRTRIKSRLALIARRLARSFDKLRMRAGHDTKKGSALPRRLESRFQIQQLIEKRREPHAIGFSQAGMRLDIARERMNIGRPLLVARLGCGGWGTARARRGNEAGGPAAQFHDVARTLLAQNLLHALDSETIAVKEGADAAQQ